MSSSAAVFTSSGIISASFSISSSPARHFRDRSPARRHQGTRRCPGSWRGSEGADGHHVQAWHLHSCRKASQAQLATSSVPTTACPLQTCTPQAPAAPSSPQHPSPAPGQEMSGTPRPALVSGDCLSSLQHVCSGLALGRELGGTVTHCHVGHV